MNDNAYFHTLGMETTRNVNEAHAVKDVGRCTFLLSSHKRSER